MAHRPSRRTRLHLLALGAYAVLAVLLTWPVARHLSTHLPGSETWAFDEYTFVWNSWWLRYSLLDLGQDPLYSTHTFYPLGVGLALYTYTLFNALISLPLQAYLSLPAISNLTFLAATVLTGYGAFVLVLYLLGRRPRLAEGADGPLAAVAAFLSGLVLAFGSYRMVYAAIGHYDLWSTAWIPFYALYLLKTIHEPRRRNAVWAGLFLAFTMLCEMSLGVFLAALSLVLLAFAAGRQARTEVAGGLGALAGRLALVALVAAIACAPLLLPVLREMAAGYELAGWGDAEKLSVDLLGLVTPTALHPLGPDWADTLRQTREGTAPFRDVNTVFLGWAGLALALAGAVRYRRRLAAWTAAALTFALLSLGPLLQVRGRSLFDLDGLQTSVPLPFILLHYLPIVKANRVPNRFSVVLMLALAVLAGFGAYWLLRKVTGWAAGRRAAAAAPGALGLLLAGLLIFDHYSVPLPLTDARIPPVYRQIAAEPGDFAILQLPLGWRNSFGVLGAESTQTQYYQSYHHKRLLSGNISRNPPFKFDYFAQVPILDSIVTLETYGQVDDGRRASDRASAAEFVGFYDIRYVVVAPGTLGRPPYVDTRAAAVAYVEEVLPVDKVYDRDGWLLYRVQRTAPAGLALDLGLGQPRESMALGEGWSGAETIQGVSARWTAAREARVFLPAAAAADYRLTLAALPFDYPGAGAQEVTLSFNGHRLPPVALSPGWGSYTWDLPAGFLHPGLNDARFTFSRVAAPADVLPGDGAIGQTGVRAPVAVEVNSGGPAGFAYISVGEGEEVRDGSVHRPGYNVAVIDPADGRLLDRRGFDTTSAGGPGEASALAEFLAGLPQGRIVAVAQQGDGAAHLDDGAVAAFRAIGGQADPRAHSAGVHAIVGVVGAAPGTALEVTGPGSGWLRAAPDRRTLGMAVDSIAWEVAR